jgi:hypothetical protein
LRSAFATETAIGIGSRNAILNPMRSFCFCVAAAVSLGSIHAEEPITARDAKVDNVQLRYLTAGRGPATVILLHGFAAAQVP